MISGGQGRTPKELEGAMWALVALAIAALLLACVLSAGCIL